MFRAKRGFTLVEILVVIVIITVLISIMLPAIQGARESARQATCIKNQRDLGRAILQYDVGKRHLPRVVSTVNPNTTTGPWFNWVEAIFPETEHNDLWQFFQQNGSFNTLKLPSGSMGVVQIKSLICPDDSVSLTMAQGNGPLSYVVNDDLFVDYSTTHGVLDKFGYATQDANASNLKSGASSVSAQQTPMLTERTIPDPANTIPHYNSCTPPGPWNGPGPPPSFGSPPTFTLMHTSGAGSSKVDLTQWAGLTFPWPTHKTPAANYSNADMPAWNSPAGYAPTPAPTYWVPITAAIATSGHPGIVVVTFFDNHTEKINVNVTGVLAPAGCVLTP
ncbi:MAG: DUF1559 domain-containing protein [Thermoguttaceae bacterium]|jgi:prepilin-type N-terminal cleavage/methylation domain-containing protein